MIITSEVCTVPDFFGSSWKSSSVSPSSGLEGSGRSSFVISASSP
jgi:hypothetical protein